MRYMFGILMLGILLTVVYGVNVSQTCPKNKSFQECAAAPIDGLKGSVHLAGNVGALGR